MRGWLHWCPHGCGKSVYWNGKLYYCERCCNIITKSGLAKINSKGALS